MQEYGGNGNRNRERREGAKDAKDANTACWGLRLRSWPGTSD
jgi:hypothetical protein